MNQEKIDYEQLYYDSVYKIKELEKKINELETDLSLIKNQDKKKILLKNEILKSLVLYQKDKRKKVKNE